MKNKIDLHTHTYYSDGTLSPTEIVKWAKKENIDQIAITDHDGIDGIMEAKIAGDALDLEVIGGIEFSAEEPDGISIHILGYHLDVDNEKLISKLKEIREKRKERNQRLIKALSDIGYPLDPEDIIKKGNTDYLGKPDFARALKKRGYIDQFGQAFENGRFLMSEELKQIKKHKISGEEAIKLIVGAGGIPVLAHPMKISGLRGEYFQKLEELIIRLKGYGLKGIECIYPEHKPEETLALIAIAEKYKLHITEGSDYHGPND